jgi:hypothetical protein
VELDDRRHPGDGGRSRPALPPATTAWLSAVTLALGVWLVAASFVLDPVMTARTVNNLIVAAVIVTEAGVSLVYGLRASRADRPAHPLGA